MWCWRTRSVCAVIYENSALTQYAHDTLSSKRCVFYIEFLLIYRDVSIYYVYAHNVLLVRCLLSIQTVRRRILSSVAKTAFNLIRWFMCISNTSREIPLLHARHTNTTHQSSANTCLRMLHIFAYISTYGITSFYVDIYIYVWASERQ